MAKEGKKVELYEILAAKRAKGKLAMPVDKTGPMYEAERAMIPAAYAREDTVAADSERRIIVDDVLEAAATAELRGFATQPPAAEHTRIRPAETASARMDLAEEAADPRRRSAREVRFGLDTVFILFIIVLALVGSAYFLGYKRGQEERPAGLVGLSDIENANPDLYGLRNLSPSARSSIHPPEQDFTLVLRTEPADEDARDRLEMELAEAMTRGTREIGAEVPGFLFRNSRGNDVRYVLAVGLGKTQNDAELSRLLQVYNTMEGITLSREPRPYIGCQIAQVRDLGAPVD